jgi:hypothetical protein
MNKTPKIYLITVKNQVKIYGCTYKWSIPSGQKVCTAKAYLQIPFVDLRALKSVEVIQTHDISSKWVHFEDGPDYLRVAMADPTDIQKTRFLLFLQAR